MSGESIPSRSPVIAAVHGVAGGAFSGGALWFVLNNLFRVNGRGWLERLLAWPAPGWLIFAGLGAAIGAIVGLIRASLERRRVAGMVEVANSLGLTYEPATDPSQLGLGDVPLFPHWSAGKHWYHGDYCGLPVGIVDVIEVQVSTSSEGGSSQSTTERTVVFLPGDDLPDFELEPRRFVHRALGAFGMAGLEFDAENAPTADEAEALRSFAASWFLAADNSLVALAAGQAGSPQLEAREAAVRQLFSPQVMETLRPFTGWSARVRQGRLALWRWRGFAAASSRPELLDEALALRQALLAGVHASFASALSAPAGAAPADRARRLIAVGVGAVIGLFAGFFGGFFVFTSLFFGNRGGHHTPLLMPLFVFGGAVLGALIGAGVGRLAAPLLKLASPARAPARMLWSSGWTAAGLFLGFTFGGMTGMALIVGLSQALGPNRLPAWLLVPLFFACPILCAIGGLLLGARYAARRAERRASGNHAAGA